MNNQQKLVLIGNGMAGMYTLEQILKIDPDRYAITVFGAENYPNYNRIMLSAVLAGDVSIDDTILNSEDWYETHDIQLHLGCPVTAIDRGKRIVKANEIEAPYDRLILATGSDPFILPIPGIDKDGVMVFRTIDDCKQMTEASKQYRRAVVIGGGLLGLEAARGLKNLGMDVHVVHLMDRLMERQLDSMGAAFLKEELEEQGIRILLEKETQEILGNGRVEGLQFKDGSTLEADIVVMAVGIRPNCALAKQNGLYCERGVVVGDTMQTYDPAIYAVGECVQHRGISYGLVAPLFEQGKVIANQMAGDGSQSYGGSIVSTKLKVSGVEVFSAGQFLESEENEILQHIDHGKRIYKKLVLQNDKIIGAVLIGDASDGPSYYQMAIDEQDISEKRAALLYSATQFGDTGHSGLKQAAAMPDDAVVCGCNGVTKGDIAKAITEQGLFTREEIINCTKASGSCGGCAPLVDQILESIHGPDVEATRRKKTLCKCTSYSRDEVVQEIHDKHLTAVREVMNVLDWKNEGCAYCRPALNYFVQMVWPEETEDDPSSRIANERHHANIQKNATYSIVPRIYGGVTNPNQLRRIADVAEKYQAKMVKITGGQRIDLLGIKKEDLPKAWADLDMPSGYAYAKALRTVKSCVGTDFCRFGVQDSIQTAIDLERKFERLNTPAKVKMAVSGCPRNCAESSIKDLGVVGIDGGWELYIGGNGGVHVRAGDLLCSVKTTEEVTEIASAYLQYYRETADYIERTSSWVERMGLKVIKQAIVEDLENRKVLAKRLDTVLHQLQDPWKAQQTKTTSHEVPLPTQFAPLKGVEKKDTQWTLVGPLNELEPKIGRVYHHNGTEIGLFRLTDDRVLAVENRCPHKQGPLSEGIVVNDFVLCPLHNWKVNLEDGQVQAPDKGCVKPYPVKLESGQIWIGLADHGDHVDTQ